MSPVIPLLEILIKNQNFRFIVFNRFPCSAGTHPMKSKKIILTNFQQNGLQGKDSKYLSAVKKLFGSEKLIGSDISHDRINTVYVVLNFWRLVFNQIWHVWKNTGLFWNRWEWWKKYWKYCFPLFGWYTPNKVQKIIWSNFQHNGLKEKDFQNN